MLKDEPPAGENLDATAEVISLATAHQDCTGRGFIEGIAGIEITQANLPFAGGQQHAAAMIEIEPDTPRALLRRLRGGRRIGSLGAGLQWDRRRRWRRGLLPVVRFNRIGCVVGAAYTFAGLEGLFQCHGLPHREWQASLWPGPARLGRKCLILP